MSSSSVESRAAAAPGDAVADPMPCPSCGARMEGRFCGECGERRLREDEFTTRRFLTDTFRELLDGADSRLWRTLRVLALRPGELTRAYMTGRRRVFLKPIQLFLLANLLYFFVQPLTGYTGFNTTLASQIDRQAYSASAELESVVRERVAERGMELGVYEQLYNLQSGNLARTLVILMVPMLAACLAVLLAPRRRPLVEHLVFSLHFYAWHLIFLSSLFLLVWNHIFAAILNVAPWVQDLAGTSWAGTALWLFLSEMTLLPFIIAYCYLAVRRVYGLGRPTAALLAVALYPVTFFVTLAYRFVLFWITYATV